MLCATTGTGRPLHWLIVCRQLRSAGSPFPSTVTGIQFSVALPITLTCMPLLLCNAD